MDAVIPAAGRGSQLGRLTDDRPKGLVDVAGRPVLAHAFEMAVDARADALVVIVGYKAGQIVDRFGDVFEAVPNTYVHQRERFGLGHAVVQAEPHANGTFLLVNGDNVFAGSVAPAIAAAGEADAVLGVEEVSPEVATTTGVIGPDEWGRVMKIVEKPAEPSSTLVTTGCYVLPADVFHACVLLRPSAEGEYQLSETVGLLIRAGYEVATVRVGKRVNVNTTEDVERAAELVD